MIPRWYKYLKIKLSPNLLAFLAKGILRLILATCRIEIKGVEKLVGAASKSPCILIFWHNRLTILPEILNRYASQLTYCGVISKSRDGELIAILTNSYKIGRTLRVPHNAKHRALSKMIHRLKNSSDVMIITPDGPKGPRYKIKPGIALAAKECEASIVPLSWCASRFWQYNTWDKLLLPKPFSRILLEFGDSITLDSSQKTQRSRDLLHLGDALCALDKKTCEGTLSDEDHWPL